MAEVKDYVKVKRLNNVKDMTLFEKGEGFRVVKDGQMTTCIHNGENVSYISCISFIPDRARGSHYHNKRVENLCVISGKIIGKYWLIDNPEDVLEIELEEGDIVTVRPGCAHSCISKEGALAVEFAAQRFELSDVIKV